MDIVVDVDGTIADASWRQHHLLVKPKNWNGFWKDMEKDPSYDDIVWLVKQLHSNGNRIIICTGRQYRHREQTEFWLKQNDIPYNEIYMRETDDHRDDSIVKVELINQMRKDGYDPYLILEDRDRVVKAYRDIGLRVLQVKYGDF